MSTAGRSRGRARTARPETTTPMPGTVEEAAPVREKSPPKGIHPETGRGRGLTTEKQPSGQVTPPEATSSEGSPPQQGSPPHPPVSVGRAAVRGVAHSVPIKTEIIGQMERLALQETTEAGPQPVPTSRLFETVIYTKPETCKGKTGETGDPIKIFCNYFEVINKPEWVLYQYHVDFTPPIDSRRMRIALMRNHDKLFPLNKAFDGSTLYSLTRLPDEETEVASTRETDKQIINIKIKRVCEAAPTSPNFIHLFNIVFRRCLKLYGMKQIDRNFYDMKRRIPIPEYGLDLINGLSTAISSFENKLLLCAELTHKLLHKTTILDMMTRIYQESKSNTQFRENCITRLVGKIVMTKYNDKTYKIDDIEWTKNPKSSFDTSRGSVTFLEYYKKSYDITISDHNQPLLLSLPSARDKRRGQTTPISLIPELCVVTGVDEKMREDFKFKRAVEQFSRVGPSDRCKRLADFVAHFKRDENVLGELNKWEMNFSDSPAEINGRVLRPESLAFGEGKIKQLNEKADWSNEMKGTPLLSPIKLTDWIIVVPMSKRHTFEAFTQTYFDVIRSMRIEANDPKIVAIKDDMPESIINALKQHVTNKSQMVVCIVTSKRKDRYDAIKRICCIENPVPSQVITSQIIDDERKRKSVITKVAIQMNCKLGGELWQTNIPLSNLMICGIDTYHDSARKNSSVCAFIATSNNTKTRFFSRATIQETHQELSNNLTITVKSACEHYYRVNNTYPEKIIIYRDGVSDGQLSLVLKSEIPQIQKAFKMISQNYDPLLTMIIVKKRGNSRFFARSRSSLENPPCGTIIDTVVTRAEWFDFYLIPQSVNQGTVNPTHFNIIYDTIGLKAEHYQRLSFKLCHMYYNWPGTIRVPATCQYAHKLAFLVGQSLHREHHTSLCDKLFYL